MVQFPGGYRETLLGEEIYSDTILQWRTSEQEWLQVAVMSQARSSHAMSVVSKQDILEYCQVDI